MMIITNANEIMNLIEDAILKWHEEEKNRADDYVIVTDDIRKIRRLNEHRNNMEEVIIELAKTNSEMWHEEDKVRSDIDATVLKAIRNINPLNQHRNDLMEEIDEIVLDNLKEEK